MYIYVEEFNFGRIIPSLLSLRFTIESRNYSSHKLCKSFPSSSLSKVSVNISTVLLFKQRLNEWKWVRENSGVDLPANRHQKFDPCNVIKSVFSFIQNPSFNGEPSETMRRDSRRNSIVLIQCEKSAGTIFRRSRIGISQFSTTDKIKTDF